MKDTILNNYCSAGVYVNVIAIDWSKPAASVDYIQSAANTAVVGQMISCVINRLSTDLNASATNYQLIGHSLGAQVSGFAGKNVSNPQIGHILGLDPAGPLFDGNPPNERLDRTDAQFVFIIHTNGYAVIPIVQGLGYLPACGDYDFYVNGGKVV